MRKWFKIIGAIILLLVVAIVAVYFIYLKPTPLPISNEDRAAITLMPLPAAMKLKGGEFLLTPEFGARINGPADQLITKAVSRLMQRVSANSNQSIRAEGKGLSITYQIASLPVQPLEVDESYELKISTNEIQVTAKTSYGVLRALESVVQLLKVENGKAYWPTLEIKDSPRYPWRGLMIDVSRHFIPKEIILRNLEAMAAVKMNVLHWHLSDYQGFRVESKVFPKLHELGSNSEYYTQKEIQEVVAFARERGIRIVPEFDMPGHASGMLVGYPELGSAPGPYKLETSFGIFAPVIDPTREDVYQFIDQFIGEMSQLFPDEYFHIGGDEVNYSHWDSNERIQTFKQENHIEDNHALQAYFNQRLEKILEKHNKKMIGWDEILNPNLSNNIVVQSWRSHKSLFQAVQKGSKAILSSGYYLDHKLSSAKHYSIDPEVMAGAVNVKPDSLHWQQYDLTLNITDNEMKTSMILYGEQDSLRGLFYMMDNAMGFEQATLAGNELTFTFTTDYGEIDFEAIFVGDSVSGKMSLGLLSFPFYGSKKGGNDVAGTSPPKVEQVRPLTEVDKKNILGGEAAMWTEVAAANNIDSRIWPRAAAMAEKWWSPAELTKDSRDMYRRLEVISSRLETLGVQHQKGQEAMIADLAEGKDQQPIRTLLEALHEVTLLDRVALDHSTLAPLREVADAAHPESLKAVKFSMQVDDFIADSTHQQNVEQIKAQLIAWRNNHAAFQTVAQGNTRLEKVLLTSEELSMMSNFALQAMDAIGGKRKLNKADKEAMQKAISGTAENRAGVYIAVKPALTKLVDAIPTM